VSKTRPAWGVAALTLIVGAAYLVKFTVDGEETFDWVKFAMIAGTMLVTVGGALWLARFSREPEADDQDAEPAPAPEEMRARARKWAIVRCVAAFACVLVLGWQMIAELNDHGVARPVHWAPYAILLLGTAGVLLKSVRALTVPDTTA
jgi:hypothetical protein